MKNEELELLKKYKKLPQEKQQIVMNVLLEELQKVDVEEKQRQAEETCKINGHTYQGKYDGWQDCSYYISEPSSIITRKRLVNSLIYYKRGKEENIRIIWRRTCCLCNKRERINKIPDIVLEQEKIKKRKSKKKQ